MKEERNESESVCSSVCSSSLYKIPSTSLLSLDCSDQSATSSSNRKNRKRQRIDMPPKSTSRLTQTVAQLDKQMAGLGESVTGDDRRKSMKSYDDTKLKKIQSSQAHYVTEKTNKSLHNIFEKTRLSFKRDTSTKPSSASQSSGKLARSSYASDPSVHMPYIDPDLRMKVYNGISDLATAGLLQVSVLQKVKDYICGDELLCMIFVKFNQEQKVTMINEFLEKNK